MWWSFIGLACQWRTSALKLASRAKLYRSASKRSTFLARAAPAGSRLSASIAAIPTSRAAPPAHQRLLDSVCAPKPATTPLAPIPHSLRIAPQAKPPARRPAITSTSNPNMSCITKTKIRPTTTSQTSASLPLNPNTCNIITAGLLNLYGPVPLAAVTSAYAFKTQTHKRMPQA